MTLAVILFVGFFSVSPLGSRSPLVKPQTEAQSPAPKTVPDQSQPSAAPPQGASDQSKPAGSAPTNAATKPKKTPRTRLHRKKVSVPPNCNPAPPADAASPQSTTQPATSGAQQPDAKGATTAPAANAPPPTNCPPSKVVVRQGGTSETSIQLVGGGSGSQASTERQNASQMLESTEANLKKIQESQLNANQQEMVNQIRQFVDQSKAATTAGDVDRARTLAWKAQLLSEELLKPQN